MLRFTDGASIDFTLEPWREPPRPPEEPFPRRNSRQATFDGAGAATEVFQDLGADPTRVIRWASSETIGFMTRAEMTDVIALYDAAASFTIETDLLVAPGDAAVLYDAWFVPQEVPQFTYATPAGDIAPSTAKDRLLFDIAVRMVPQ